MAAKSDAKSSESKSEPKVENKTTAVSDKNLELALQAIAKEYGEGSIMRLGDASSKLSIEVIPTGSIAIDTALGVGGFPRGRIIEIFGPESSGKTTLTLTVIAQAQRNSRISPKLAITKNSASTRKTGCTCLVTTRYVTAPPSASI